MSSHENRLDYVDAMRGIAILMVVLVHTVERVPNLNSFIESLGKYGQMGVQLFFVISAYTLCLSFERRGNEPNKISSFYIRRFFRIAPLYYAAILIYFIVHLVNQFYKGSISWVAAYSPLNTIANIFFIHGFIPSANNNIVPGGWSIGTEMIFYMCFPLLFEISRKIAKNHPFHLFSLLFFCLGINLALQVIIARIFSYSISKDSFLYFNQHSFFYFNIINQLPVFILGIIAYFLHSQKVLHSAILSRSISILGFLLFSAIPLALWKSKFQFVFAIIPTISAISFVFLLNWLKSIKHQNSLLCRIGMVSYSMYIFHFLFARILTPIIIEKIPHIINPILMLLLSLFLNISLSFSVALVTEQLIEAKGILVGKKVISYLQERVNLF